MTSEDTRMAASFFSGLIQGWVSRMEGNAELKDDMMEESKRLAKLGRVKLK